MEGFEPPAYELKARSSNQAELHLHISNLPCFRTSLASTISVASRLLLFRRQVLQNVLLINLRTYKGLRFSFLWWAPRDSNPELIGYEPIALTNCTRGPFGTPCWARTNNQQLRSLLHSPFVLRRHLRLSRRAQEGGPV